MKPLRWNPDKSKLLKAIRGIDLEMVALAIHQGRVLDVTEHPNQAKYPSQKIFVLAIDQSAVTVSETDGRSQAAHGSAAAFIEATTTGFAEILLERLTRFKGFGAILDDGLTTGNRYKAWGFNAGCIYTLALAL